MHFLMFVTISMPEGTTSADVCDKVYDELMNDDSFCGNGGRFGSPLCDGFVIGGRWSGILAQTVIGESYFRPSAVVDPMMGSGTCRDVYAELDIPCYSWDIHQGFDACNPVDFSSSQAFDFIFCHPPYWRQKLYADDPRDLSRAPTLRDFLRRYEQFIRNCARALKRGGKLAILMGDYHDKDEGMVPLTYYTKAFAFAAGLKQATTDIIRFSHGASSSRKVYQSSFIPGLHDVCSIFSRP